jgi:hypothetical protein
MPRRTGDSGYRSRRDVVDISRLRPHSLIEMGAAPLAVPPLEGSGLDRMGHPVGDFVTVAVAVGYVAVDHAQHSAVVPSGPAVGEHHAPELLC